MAVTVQGPKALPIVGSAFEFRKDPVGFFQNLDKEYKGICKLKLGLVDGFFVTDPELVKEVLQTKNKSFKKGSQYKQLTYFLQKGLLTNEGESWFKQRRLVQPTFYKKSIENFFNSMVKYADVILEEWKSQEESNALESMNKFTLAVIGESVFSSDLTTEAKGLGESISHLVEDANIRIQNVVNWPIWMPVPQNLKFKKVKNAVDDVVYDLIKNKRAHRHNSADLTDLLLEVKDEETGEKMSDEQVRDELMTVFVAGHETTAIALAWALYLISQNKEVEQKIKDELERVLVDGKIEAASLWQLSYLRAVIDETMRLYPPAWIMGRQADKDEYLGDVLVKEGKDVILSPYAVHRSERLWDNPNEFDPERFVGEKKKAIHKYAYFPFGGGPRICIGEHFAYLEMLVMLANVYSKGRIELLNIEPVEVLPLVTLRPEEQIRLKFISN